MQGKPRRGRLGRIVARREGACKRQESLFASSAHSRSRLWWGLLQDLEEVAVVVRPEADAFLQLYPGRVASEVVIEARIGRCDEYPGGAEHVGVFVVGAVDQAGDVAGGFGFLFDHGLE